MAERTLERFLRKLTGADVKKGPAIEEEENQHDASERTGTGDKLLVMQRIIEKILGYLFTTIETTETRLADFKVGINNVNSYLNQQLHDLTSRLKELPGMGALKEVAIPEVTFGQSPGEATGQFMTSLQGFIEQAARDIVAGRGGPATERVTTTREESDDADSIRQKMAELAEKERFLSMLAEQLASKELQLQDREKTIEIIESGLEDKLTLTAAMEIAGKKESGEEDLAELSKLSESILQGDMDDEPDADFNDLDAYMNGDEDDEDEA